MEVISAGHGGSWQGLSRHGQARQSEARQGKVIFMTKKKKLDARILFVRLDEETSAKLNELCERTARERPHSDQPTKSEIVRELIRRA